MIPDYLREVGDKAETQEDKAIAQSVVSNHMNKIVEKLKKS